LFHRVRTGDEEKVELLVANRLQGRVLLGDAFGGPVAARDAVHHVTLNFDGRRPRSLIEQLQELAFGRIEGAVGHVVDECALHSVGIGFQLG
jgi:hypothetical protein